MPDQDDILFQYGRYYVTAINDHDTGNGKEIPGYGVVNEQTGVVEFSHTMLYQAMKWARILEIQVSQIENSDEPDEDDKWPTLNTIN